ncbi:hypothetical protein MNEG_12584, partial [Monoraphidium neglectum]
MEPKHKLLMVFLAAAVGASLTTNIGASQPGRQPEGVAQLLLRCVWRVPGAGPRI